MMRELVPGQTLTALVIEPEVSGYSKVTVLPDEVVSIVIFSKDHKAIRANVAIGTAGLRGLYEKTVGYDPAADRTEPMTLEDLAFDCAAALLFDVIGPA